jgi:AcrR family transcriptional regulator
MPILPSPGTTQGGRRERRRLDTEQRIMSVALRLFCERGFGQTTVDEIVAEADIAKGTFFNYFSSKERLLLAFGERLTSRLAAAAVTISPTAPIIEQLRAAIHLAVGEWQGNQRLLRALIGTALSTDSLATAFEVLLAQARSNVALLMREGQRRGEVRVDLEATELARLLQQSMLGTQLIWSLRPASNLDAAVDQALDVFWRGIGFAADPPPHLALPGSES